MPKNFFGSPRWSLYLDDFWKIGKGGLIAGGAVTIAYWAAGVANLDDRGDSIYGFLIVLASMGLNALNQWYQDHTKP